MFDKSFNVTVTVEDLPQILFVWHGRKNFNTEIAVSTEKAITFWEYVNKIYKRALAKFNRVITERKKKDVFAKRDEEEDLWQTILHYKNAKI